MTRTTGVLLMAYGTPRQTDENTPAVLRVRQPLDEAGRLEAVDEVRHPARGAH